jgi:heme iron utilization protein
VNVATDVTGHPLILISRSPGTRKIFMANPRASLMVAEIPPSGDALTGPRVTVMGRFVKVEDEGIRRRYLARHPAGRASMPASATSPSGAWSRSAPMQLPVSAGSRR